MRYLKIDLSKCDAGATCNFECEVECAKKVFKSDDRAHSAIRVREIVAAGGSAQRVEMVCDQCGDCIAICPVNALTRNRLGIVMLDKKICTGCYMCVGFCPTETFGQRGDWVEPFKCTACGICVRVCPHAALEITEGPLPEQQPAAQAEERV